MSRLSRRSSPPTPNPSPPQCGGRGTRSASFSPRIRTSVSPRARRILGNHRGVGGVALTCPPPLTPPHRNAGGGERAVHRSRGALQRPGFAQRDHHKESFRLASGAHDPEKWRPVFGQRSCATKKGSGAPRGALSNQCPHRRQVYAVCVTHLLARLRALRRARLSALTLAALATGYDPDGSAPEPGFPRLWLTGVLPASPQKLPRFSTLRADRS